MKIEQGLKIASFGILAFGSLTSLLTPTLASAATTVSGNATFTIDNTAVAASNPAHWVFQTFWDSSNNALKIDGNTTGGTTLSSSGISALVLPVNTNTTTQITSTELYGRTLQATTMDPSNTAAGQIGLSGALRMRDPGQTTYLAPYDFTLVKTAGQWTIRSFDNAFSYGPIFNLANVSESLDVNGALLLSGDLKWNANGFSWATLLGANPNSVVGSFSLAPAPVPVPAAVWMFGTGLLGLLGAARRKSGIAG